MNILDGIKNLQFGIESLQFVLETQDNLGLGSGPTIESLKLIHEQYTVLVVNYFAEELGIDDESESMYKKFKKYDINFDEFSSDIKMTEDKLLRYAKIRDRAYKKHLEREKSSDYLHLQWAIERKLRE